MTDEIRIADRLTLQGETFSGIVDMLANIARALENVAEATERVAQAHGVNAPHYLPGDNVARSIDDAAKQIAGGLHAVAKAIGQK